jgi:hypothetical protein
MGSMNNRLDYIPEGKRRELAFVVEVAREGLAQMAAQRTAPTFRQGQLLKIILIGTYVT